MSTQLSFSSKGKPAVPELRALFCIPLDETVMSHATKYVQDKGEAGFIRLVGTGYGDEPLSLLVKEQYLLKSRSGTCSHCRLRRFGLKLHGFSHSDPSAITLKPLLLLCFPPHLAGKNVIIKSKSFTLFFFW